MVKKILLTIILVSLIFPSFLVFYTKPAEATGGLTSFISKVTTSLMINLGLKRASQAVYTMTTVPVLDTTAALTTRTEEKEMTYQEILKALFKMFLEITKKRLLNYLTNQIITWIQGGGEPKFVPDWKDLLWGEAARGRSDTIQEIASGLICPAFVDALQENLGVQFPNEDVSHITSFAGSLACNPNIRDELPRILLRPNYNELSFLQPQNTYYGALGIIQNEMAERAAHYAQAAQNEALAGGGFLSHKKCVEWKDGIEGGTCLRYTIITPGQTIGSLVSKAVGSDIDYIVNAQELEQYVAAIANAAINRLIKEGLASLNPPTKSDAEWQSIEYTSNLTTDYAQATINQGNLDQIIEQYQKAGDELNTVLAIKQQTLSIASTTVQILQDCGFSSSSDAVVNAEADVSRVQQGIDNVNNLIGETYMLLAEAQNVKQNPSSNEQVVENVSQKFGDFTNRNISAIYSAKKSSEEELDEQQTKFEQAQRQCASYYYNR